MQVKIYSANQTKRELRSILIEMWSDLISSRELAWRLAVRDIKSMYRQSYLGILWAFFTPLMNTLVWIFMDSTGVVDIQSSIIPYPVYVFTGAMLWSILLESIMSPLQQTQSAQSIMSKINFPKEALIVSGVYKILFNTSIKIFIILVVVLLMGISPGWQIVLLPLALMSIVFCGTVIGMIITPVGMLYTDIGRGLSMLLQALMYLCPVVYVTPKSGNLANIVSLNPLTPLITTARSWLTGLPAEHLQYLLIVNLFALFFLLFTWLFYRISIPIIVERLSS